MGFGRSAFYAGGFERLGVAERVNRHEKLLLAG
jgi:hypothetical protein